MDYSVRSILVQKLSSRRFANVDMLKAALKRGWGKITVEQCVTIIGNFRKRVEKCTEGKEINFEHVIIFFVKVVSLVQMQGLVDGVSF